MRKSDLLVEETLAFARGVGSAASDRDERVIQTTELIESVLQSKLPKPKDMLFKNEDIQKRLSEFKAIQHKFAREREEFYEKTMSKVRPSLSRDDV